MRRVSPRVDSQLHRELHGTMSDRYQAFTSSSLGQLLVKNLGLPDPPTLERYIYQFRLGPTPKTINRLISLLPADKAEMWAGAKTARASGY